MPGTTETDWSSFKLIDPTEQDCKEKEQEYDKILDVAMIAARRAGMLMKQHCGAAKVDKTKDNAVDLATKIDSQCEEIIKSAALLHFPHHQILGEESVDPGSKAAEVALAKVIDTEWLWVVDPIDGTTNFVHGLPASVVSIGVAHKAQVVVGVIFDPYHNEMFTAVRGKGAFVNGQPMRVDGASSMIQALFSMYPCRKAYAQSFNAIQELYEMSRGVRNMGAAAIHLAWVAAGRLSGFVQLDLCPWDLAAGSLLVTEAGGKVTGAAGQPYTLAVRDMCCSNGLVHTDLLEILRKHDAHEVRTC